MARLVLLVVTAASCAAGCFKPPERPIVDGPTLTMEIATVSEANVAGVELIAAAPLNDAAEATLADFLGTNANLIDSERLVGLQGARVLLRPGAGVGDLADAFTGLMMFVAPDADPAARVFLASGIVLPGTDSVEMELMGSRSAYERVQAVFTTPDFLVGVSGPTSLGSGSGEFGLTLEMDLAVFEIVTREGGH